MLKVDVHPMPGAAALAALQDKRVLVIGDLMLDTYLSGDAERISPEAPVPVVRIESEAHLLGGAGNVACNITALGGAATIIGAVGHDAAGEHLRTLLHDRGIRAVLTRLNRRTTVKTRVMARRQQMLRLDQEDIHPLSDDERALLMHSIRAEIIGHQVVIVSDYAKGLLDAAFSTEFAAVIAGLPHAVTVLADPKPQHFGLFDCATLITPNLKETGEGVHMPVTSRAEIIAAGQEALRRVGCKHLLCTLGPQGMALFVSEEEVWHIPSMARDVFDVTGAGDTVIATVGLALAAGCSLLDACIIANSAAGIVVGKVGAATAKPADVAAELGGEHKAIPSRWV